MRLTEWASLPLSLSALFCFLCAQRKSSIRNWNPSLCFWSTTKLWNRACGFCEYAGICGVIEELGACHHLQNHQTTVRIILRHSTFLQIHTTLLSFFSAYRRLSFSNAESQSSTVYWHTLASTRCDSKFPPKTALKTKVFLLWSSSWSETRLDVSCIFDVLTYTR